MPKPLPFDSHGRVIAQFSRALEIATPQEGMGRTVSGASACRVAGGDFSRSGRRWRGACSRPGDQQTSAKPSWAGIGETGEAIAPALSWQCARTAAFCHMLREQGHEPQIKAVTGLPVAPLFSASKMRWLLDHTPDGLNRAKNGEICLGTVDSWLLWHLTQGQHFCCDYANASRTQLMNLHTADWDTDMLALFGIPRAALPVIKPSSGLFGYTAGLATLPDGIPVMAMIGDSHAALFAHGLGAAGCVKATYGTGTSVMAPVDSVAFHVSNLATTVAWHDGEKLVYALEGNIPHTGDAVAWMADSTGLSERSPAELAQALNALPRSVDSTLGVFFVPALTGMGAPWWDDKARGLIHGLSRGVKRAHLIRAALESITYQIADVITAMRAHHGFTLNTLLVDGGTHQKRLVNAVPGRPARLSGDAPAMWPSCRRPARHCWRVKRCTS
ncbi:putative carbohydrate kinase [Klebsiella pneumoniae]|uniref:ATP:glycerol 3-phosphotransferase n=1 Tax=Klebsiella pneumoniae TaxID=573 RepID=A0A2X3F2V1_KLEPN|nr:putative carbohydrate kinase [Klebsiella pneumoniae]